MSAVVAPQTQTETHEHHGEANTVWGWMTTVDHKRIGKLYLFSSLAFFIIGGIDPTNEYQAHGFLGGHIGFNQFRF